MVPPQLASGHSRERVVVAMSGGVDSSVAAGLLVETGYEVIGVTMKMYAPSRTAYAKSCCGADDFDDARRSAAILGVPHYVLDFEATFERNVVAPFVEAYRNGRTPNPCVACNNFVKLGALRRYADRLGARRVATGHYARVEHRADGPHLFAARSATKDQSYTLAQLAPAQLAGLLLPLGELDKTATRAHAARLRLPVHDKPDSQDICFVEGGAYQDVLATRRAAGEPTGPVVTVDGVSVGTHPGISNYTVGQRRALPATHFNDGPRYVTRIDAATNTIVIGREDELSADGLIADAVNLIRPTRFATGSIRVQTMTRYRAPRNWALANIDADGALRLRFEWPERAIAPGQLVALYAEDGDEVLAGATIRAVTPPRATAETA